MPANPHQKSATSTAADFAAVTPDNTTDLPQPARALYVGTAGNVVAVTLNGAAVTFKNVGAGSVLPVVIRRVNATNTTAGDLVALY